MTETIEMTEATAPEQDPVTTAMGLLLSDLASTTSTLLVGIGLRTGLWEALAEGEATVEEVVARSGVAEPYAREWLSSLAAAGYLTYEPASTRFGTAAGFDALTVGPLRGLTQGSCTQLGVWWGLAHRYDEVFRTGAGISWAELPPVHAEAMDQITRAVVVPSMVESWLPAIDGLAARLGSGGTVADVGCGYGATTIALAEAFPSARFTGIDADDASVSRARAAATGAGVADRVRFEVASADGLAGGPYDLVVFVDSLHDLGRPETALARAAEHLTESGVVLLVEHGGSDRLEENLNPIGQFFYACSALVCVPNALADRGGGRPLGSIPGEARLRSLAAEAGFGRVQRLDVVAPMHLLLELRR